MVQEDASAAIWGECEDPDLGHRGSGEIQSDHSGALSTCSGSNLPSNRRPESHFLRPSWCTMSLGSSAIPKVETLTSV